MRPGLDPFAVLDWRRRVQALYAEVRAVAGRDAAAAHAVWVAGRDDLFGGHAASPLLPGDRAVFDGLRYAPYDPGLRFEVAVGAAAPLRWEVATGTDGVVPFVRAGVVRLGGIGVLDVWALASYGGGVFLPLRDGLAGRDTYGGGRYVLDTIKGADLGGSGSRLVVDLNFAYNPSCAYDPEWACPLAPAGNRVDVPVRAGELQPVAR